MKFDLKLKKPNLKMNPSSKTNLVGMYAIGGLLLLVIAIFLFIKPSLDKAGQRKAELDTYRGQIAKLEQLERDTNDMRGEYAALEANKEEIVQLVPPSDDEAGLLRILNELGKDTGVTIGSFTPSSVAAPTDSLSFSGPAAGAGGTLPYSFGITAIGSYPQVFNFINAVENGPRVMDISSVQFTTRSAGLSGETAAISASLEINAYSQGAPTSTPSQGGN